jgi:hypothetical protein
MSYKEWNPDDYKFEFADIPAYSGELIDMPIEHKIVKLKEFLVDEIFKDAINCIRVHSELSALFVALASVDYLSGFFTGKQSNRQAYISFMHSYFPLNYEPLVDTIYSQLRCGLMHNLVIANPWKSQYKSFLIHPNSQNHLSTDQDNKIVFSVLIFIEDIRRAFCIYAHDLIMKADINSDLVKNFHKRFNKLDGIGAFMIRVPD